MDKKDLDRVLKKSGDDQLIAAATVVLVRDSDEGLQTLLLRRNAKLNFAGGNWVFPGGRIDPEDHQTKSASDDLSTQVSSKDREYERACERPEGEFQAARQAAVRETFEEAGLTIGDSNLVYFAHWIAPPLMNKRFSTWFFVLPINDILSEEIQIDHGEIHEARWLTASQALENAESKEMSLLPPTVVTLSELARYQTCEALTEYYRNRKPVVFSPHVFIGEDDTPSAGKFVFIYNGDAGYDNSNPDAAGERHRLSSVDGVWHYENTVYQ